MSEFIYESEKTDQIFTALLEFDKKDVSMDRDATGQRNDYISKGYLLKTTRPLLVECGLRITRTTRTIDGKQYIVHEVRHVVSGQFIRSYHFYNDMVKHLDYAYIQILGGIRTYVSRYEISDMLYIDDLGEDPDQIVTEDEESQSKNKLEQQPGCITPEQSSELFKVLIKYPKAAEVIKKEFNFKHTLYLKAEHYGSVKRRINELVTSK